MSNRHLEELKLNTHVEVPTHCAFEDDADLAEMVSGRHYRLSCARSSL